jgi:hypothetical protein
MAMTTHVGEGFTDTRHLGGHACFQVADGVVRSSLKKKVFMLGHIVGGVRFSLLHVSSALGVAFPAFSTPRHIETTQVEYVVQKRLVLWNASPSYLAKDQDELIVANENKRKYVKAARQRKTNTPNY